MKDHTLLSLFSAVKRGDLQPDEAQRRWSERVQLGFAYLDHERTQRTGLPEVIFGLGKTPEQLASIARAFVQAGSNALITRIDREKALNTLNLFPGGTYEEVPRLLWYEGPLEPAFAPRNTRPLWVLAAGTSDLPVAEEAARCAEWFGLSVTREYDIGVAGLHRLLDKVNALQKARVIICVAGMEGALPTVVAGLVKAPIIAVPTSIGYGTHLNGFTPLMAMLSGCSGGTSVVNIDNGFGAAQVAARVLFGDST